KKFSDTIPLPGSMAENGKGNDVSLNTQWTGQIVDSSWFHDEKYATYRTPENLKIPFWLQPEKHFIGVAWYQKEVVIPAEWKGKHIELALERPHWETQLWINDQYIGIQNSLGTAHIYDLGKYLKIGKNSISIRIDNRVKDIDPGRNSHSISDHTQSNWNGIVGAIKLHSTPTIYIKNIKLYTDIASKTVTIVGEIGNLSGEAQKCNLTAQAKGLGKNNQILEQITKEIQIDA